MEPILEVVILAGQPVNLLLLCCDQGHEAAEWIHLPAEAVLDVFADAGHDCDRNGRRCSHDFRAN